jgi:chromosome segregation protein
LKAAEAHRETIQQHNNRLGVELSLSSSEFSAQSARLEQQQHRLAQLDGDLEDIGDELAENSASLIEFSDLQEEFEQRMAEQEQQRHTLDALNQMLQTQQQQSEQAMNEVRQQVYGIKSKIDALHATEMATAKQIERLTTQHQHAIERIGELENKLQQTLRPLDAEKQQLAERILAKNELEIALKNHQMRQQDIELASTELSEQHTRSQRALATQKETLDTLRFELQACKVRQQSINEQLDEMTADAEQVLKNLSEHAEEQGWKRKADDLTTQIERLGTINLTAIEEYKAQAERLRFLNEQQADLMEALHILDQAISKIDKESRLRFKATFDKINSGLQEKFPKLFGGGQAYLELTDSDLLESGVNIIARPPGKRNSSIHLLSGGEKALTAVALVFSIFELNPAPFCLLDEVDAPLDDANVGRFSKMVEEMSASVQFLYISHNKVTMEIAKQLTGVTMKEPGVSRMVAVDIEEAVSLAEI